MFNRLTVLTGVFLAVALPAMGQRGLPHALAPHEVDLIRAYHDSRATDDRGVTTPPPFATWGADTRKTINGTMALWTGNVQRDGSLRYTGSGNDRDPILVNVGSTTPNNTRTEQLP